MKETSTEELYVLAVKPYIARLESLVSSIEQELRTIEEQKRPCDFVEELHKCLEKIYLKQNDIAQTYYDCLKNLG